MNLGLLLRVSAVYMALVGVGLVVSPDGMMFGVLGANPTPVLIATLRIFASTFIGIAVLNWVSSGAGPSPARNAIVLGNTVGFAIAGVLGVVAFTSGAPTVSVAFAVVDLLFAAGFFMAGRASMAAGTA